MKSSFFIFLLIRCASFNIFFLNAADHFQTQNVLYALQALRKEIPERLWMQEFSILVDRFGYQKDVDRLMNHPRREPTLLSGYEIAHSKRYFLEATMSGETVRILDRYEMFLESPFWLFPSLLEKCYLLEGN